MPRFNEQNFGPNLSLLKEFLLLAKSTGIAPAELAIAWLLAQGDHIIALPGTTSLAHLQQNAGASHLQLDPAIIAKAGQLINQHKVHGPRYDEEVQATVDTEEF